MAVLENQTNTLDQESQQAGGEQQLGPQSSGSFSASPTSSTPTSTGSKGSGAFTNLRDYLKANKQRTERLSGQIGQNVQKQAGQLQSQFQQRQQEALSPIQQQLQKYGGEGGVSQLKSQLYGQIQGQGSPYTQEQFRQFAAPQERFNVEAPTFDTAKREQFRQQVGQLGTGAGRQQALNQLAGPSRYTGGAKSLDSLLLGRSQEARQNLAQTQRSALSQVNTQQEEQARTQFQEQLGEAQKRQQDIAEYLSGKGQGLSNEEKLALEQSGVSPEEIQRQDIAAQRGQLGLAGFDVEKTLEHKRAGLESEQRRLSQAYEQALLGEGQLSAADAEALGLSQYAGRNLYGTEGMLASYGLQGGQSPFIQDVASQEDLARAQALARLSGTCVNPEQAIDLAPEVGGIIDPSKVGQYQGLGVNKTVIDDILNQAQKQYETTQSQWMTDTAGKIAAEKQAFGGYSTTVGGLGSAEGQSPGRYGEYYTPENRAQGLLAMYQRVKPFIDAGMAPSTLGGMLGMHSSEAQRLIDVGKLAEAQEAEGGLKQYYEQNIQGRGKTLGFQ